ncbi:DUF6232 family protein [Streptomyces sp. GS7]|uniref:DUF6232 family protein n=1 Tax=Streptomyces sp. GS7 TaxID=2692234 RepID=UPI001319742D|nr:DUF6232 family protein [Streptomyces sp. GS7]QHC26449.1 hypothetical protein GR130_38860 [Streptomyces sp. GS7]
MPDQHGVIDVKVSRRVLWVGADAYPMHNITRARRTVIPPRRGYEIWRFLKAVAGLVLVGTVVMVVVTVAAGDPAPGDPGSWLSPADVVAVAVLLLIIAGVVRLIRALIRPVLYALVLETSASENTVLVSADEERVIELVRQITGAIENASAEFQLTVESLHVGDVIKQFGKRNIGKVVR